MYGKTPLHLIMNAVITTFNYIDQPKVRMNHGTLSKRVDVTEIISTVLGLSFMISAIHHTYIDTICKGFRDLFHIIYFNHK